jgi:hypothetical protein
MVGGVAAEASKELLGCALSRMAQAVHAAHTVRATPPLLPNAKVELVKSLRFQTALLVENLLAMAASEVVIALGLIVTDLAPIARAASFTLLGDRGSSGHLIS